MTRLLKWFASESVWPRFGTCHFFGEWDSSNLHSNPIHGFRCPLAVSKNHTTSVEKKKKINKQIGLFVIKPCQEQYFVYTLLWGYAFLWNIVANQTKLFSFHGNSIFAVLTHINTHTLPPRSLFLKLAFFFVWCNNRLGFRCVGGFYIAAHISVGWGVEVRWFVGVGWQKERVGWDELAVRGTRCPSNTFE